MSASRPTFSVIIPTYGRSRFLDDAVASVLRQSVSDFECLVIDDASPTPAVLEGDPRIRVVRRSTNGGPAAARNTGLAEAKGEYVAFLDDDDLFVPDRLAFARSGLSNAPLAICWTQVLGAERGGGRMLNGNVRDSILDATTPHLGATAVRRDVAEPFDERFIATQDVEWWLRMSARTSVWTVPEGRPPLSQSPRCAASQRGVRSDRGEPHAHEDGAGLLRCPSARRRIPMDEGRAHGARDRRSQAIAECPAALVPAASVRSVGPAPGGFDVSFHDRERRFGSGNDLALVRSLRCVCSMSSTA